MNHVSHYKCGILCMAYSVPRVMPGHLSAKEEPQWGPASQLLRTPSFSQQLMKTYLVYQGLKPVWMLMLLRIEWPGHLSVQRTFQDTGHSTLVPLYLETCPSQMWLLIKIYWRPVTFSEPVGITSFLLSFHHWNVLRTLDSNYLRPFKHTALVKLSYCCKVVKAVYRSFNSMTVVWNVCGLAVGLRAWPLVGLCQWPKAHACLLLDMNGGKRLVGCQVPLQCPTFSKVAPSYQVVLDSRRIIPLKYDMTDFFS